MRAKPQDAKLRVFLFQLLCVLGQWDRALNQLNVAAQLDASALAMAQMYREAIRCELLRAEVFEGATPPMVFGQPEEWLALLIESLLLAGRGKAKESAELRARAFDGAPGTAGTVGDQPFEWIADADSRLGPVLEAIINGRYYWVPFARLAQVAIEAPEDLRDVVWMPAHLGFANGGESVALVPTRYPGSELSQDGQILLARKTVWAEPAPDVVSRPRPAAARHRCGRDRADGRANDRVRVRRCRLNSEDLPEDGRTHAAGAPAAGAARPAGGRRAAQQDEGIARAPRPEQGSASARRCCAISPGSSTRPTSPRTATSGRHHEVARSVLNFGLPALAGQTASALDIVDLERLIRQAILDFEPRILPGTLEVEPIVSEDAARPAQRREHPDPRHALGAAGAARAAAAHRRRSRDR